MKIDSYAYDLRYMLVKDGFDPYDASNTDRLKVMFLMTDVCEDRYTAVHCYAYRSLIVDYFHHKYPDMLIVNIDVQVEQHTQEVYIVGQLTSKTPAQKYLECWEYLMARD